MSQTHNSLSVLWPAFNAQRRDCSRKFAMKATKSGLLKLGEALLANPIANSNNAGKLLIHITKPEENEVRSSV